MENLTSKVVQYWCEAVDIIGGWGGGVSWGNLPRSYGQAKKRADSAFLSNTVAHTERPSKAEDSAFLLRTIFTSLARVHELVERKRFPSG